MLLDFFVNSHFLQDGVVFLQLQSFGCVLFVFGADIAAGTRLTTGFVFCTLQNHLHPVTFLCHGSMIE